MNHARLYATALTGTMKRDALIFVSYRLRVITQLLGVLFSLVTFYYVAKLVKPTAVGPRDQYFAYVTVGILVTSVLTAALNSVLIVRAELIAGNFERILVSPFGPVWGVLSVVAFPIVYAVTLSIVSLAIAVPLFGLSLHALGIPPAIGVILLGAVSLASIGMLFVAALLAFKTAAGVTWVIAGLSLLGGAYFPLQLFPVWIRWIAAVQPYTPTMDLLRHLLVGTTTTEPAGLEVGKLIGFAIVLVPLAGIAVTLAIRHSLRRGTIMEY